LKPNLSYQYVGVSAFAVIVSVLLVSCGVSNQIGETCKAPLIEPESFPKSSSEQSPLTDGCIRHWAYRMSAASGESSELAHAVVAACRGAVNQEIWISEREREKGVESNSNKDEIEKRSFEQAIFRVVQSRAGDCSPSGGP
jgi:hypothetical protein